MIVVEIEISGFNWILLNIRYWAVRINIIRTIIVLLLIFIRNMA